MSRKGGRVFRLKITDFSRRYGPSSQPASWRPEASRWQSRRRRMRKISAPPKSWICGLEPVAQWRVNPARTIEP